jgi:hypothetical protein
MQFKIENLSLRTLQMEEVGIFFFIKENFGNVSSVLKVPLKAKIVQNLFSQIHQNYAKYTFETFTVDGITIAYQIECMA